MGSELPAYELSTHRRENTPSNNKYTFTHLQLLEMLRSMKPEKSRLIHKTCACLRTNKHLHNTPNKHTHTYRLLGPPLLHLCIAMTAVDDPEMENNLQLLARPDDTQTHAHACSLVFTVVVSSSHSPMKITWWTGSSSKTHLSISTTKKKKKTSINIF